MDKQKELLKIYRENPSLNFFTLKKTFNSKDITSAIEVLIEDFPKEIQQSEILLNNISDTLTFLSMYDYSKNTASKENPKERKLILNSRTRNLHENFEKLYNTRNYLHF